MKTEGLSFLEAVQALKDGRAEAAMSKTADFVLTPSTARVGLSTFPRFLATDYVLVSPIIPTEEREVKRWISLDANGKPSGTFAQYPNWLSDKWQIIELTGTYRAPVMENVQKKKVSWETSFDEKGRDNGLYPDRPLDIRGKSGTLTFEYEE